MNDRRSTSAYCTFVGSNLVSWRSNKQSVVTRSRANVEFQDMKHELCEMLWIRGFQGELRFHSHDLMRLYCDNKAVIRIAHDPVPYDKTNHVEVNKYFIKEKLQTKQIYMSFVKTEDQIADVFTKGLCSPSFSKIVCKLGMHTIYIPA